MSVEAARLMNEFLKKLPASGTSPEFARLRQSLGSESLSDASGVTDVDVAVALVVAQVSEAPAGCPVEKLVRFAALRTSDAEVRTFIRTQFAAGLYGAGLEALDAKLRREIPKTKRKLAKKLLLGVLDELREAVSSQIGNSVLDAEDLLDVAWLWRSVGGLSKSDASAAEIGNFLFTETLDTETTLVKAGWGSFYRERLEWSLGALPAETKRAKSAEVERLASYLASAVSASGADGVSEELFRQVGLCMQFAVTLRKFASPLPFPRTFVRALADVLRGAKGATRKFLDVARPAHDLLCLHFLAAPAFSHAALAASRDLLLTKGVLRRCRALCSPEAEPPGEAGAGAGAGDGREQTLQLLRAVDDVASEWARQRPGRPAQHEVWAFLNRDWKLNLGGAEQTAERVAELVRLAVTDAHFRGHAELVGRAIAGDGPARGEFLRVFAGPGAAAEAAAAAVAAGAAGAQAEQWGLLGAEAEVVAVVGALEAVLGRATRLQTEKPQPWRVAVEWRRDVTRTLRRAEQTASSVLLTSAAQLTHAVQRKLDAVLADSPAGAGSGGAGGGRGGRARANATLAKYLTSQLAGGPAGGGPAGGGGWCVEGLRQELVSSAQSLFFAGCAETEVGAEEADAEADRDGGEPGVEVGVVERYGLRVGEGARERLETALSGKVKELAKAVETGRLVGRLARLTEELQKELEKVGAVAVGRVQFQRELERILEEVEEVAKPVAHAISVYVTEEEVSRKRQAWETLAKALGVGNFLKAFRGDWEASKAPWPLEKARQLVRQFREYAVRRELVVCGLETATKEAFPEGPATHLARLLEATLLEEQRRGQRGERGERGPTGQRKRLVRRVFEEMRKSGLFAEEVFEFRTWRAKQLTPKLEMEELLETLPLQVQEELEAEGGGSGSGWTLVQTLGYLQNKYDRREAKESAEDWGERRELFRSINAVVQGMKNSKDKDVAKVALLWRSDSFEEFMERVAKLSSSSSANA